MAASQNTMWPVPSLAAVPTHPEPTTYMIWERTSAVRPSSLRKPALCSLTERIRSADEGDLRSVTPGDESLHQSIDANPACRDGASHRGEAGLLRGVGDTELSQDAYGAVGVVFLDVGMDLVEVEGGLRDPVVFFQRLRHVHDVRRVDRLRRDVAAAERFDRARTLEGEQLVFLDDSRRQILGVENLVAREAERFAEPNEENRVAGLFAADGVLAALFNDERDERALPLEVIPRRRSAADRDDLPRSVPERVEEERTLLADDVADLIARELAIPDHVEQRMVQPGVRVLRLLQELLRELGRRKHCRSPSRIIDRIHRPP